METIWILGQPVKLDRTGEGLKKNDLGKYEPETRTITLKPGVGASILLHEIWHAAIDFTHEERKLSEEETAILFETVVSDLWYNNYSKLDALDADI